LLKTDTKKNCPFTHVYIMINHLFIIKLGRTRSLLSF